MTTKAKGTSIRQKIIDLGKKLSIEPRDLETVKTQAEVDLNDGVWFRFESQVDLVLHNNSAVVNLGYTNKDLFIIFKLKI